MFSVISMLTPKSWP